MLLSMMEVEKIRDEFQRISSMGYVLSDRPEAEKNDGAVGNTFETLLGVDENNYKDPDFEGWEVKTQRRYSKSASSLFTSKPTFPAKGDEYMRENWGISDPSGECPHIKCFRTSIYAHRWSVVYERYKMKLHVDDENQKLFILLCDLDENLIDGSVYWSFEDLQKASLKLKNTFVVSAEETKIDGLIHFRYVSGKAFVGFRFKNLINLIKEGLARYDNRLGIYRTGPKAGSKHNHGGGIRLLSTKHYPKLFEYYVAL